MWSNFLTVLRAILFTFLALGLVYEAKVADDWRTRCRRVEKERDDARRLNSTYADREHQRRISDAYNRVCRRHCIPDVKDLHTASM